MRMSRLILFGLACLFFVIATFASWYEGSDLVENPFEWENTAIITSWLHDGEIERTNISQFDYFIYAVKFKPTFPIIMMISLVYILFKVGQLFLKGIKQFSYFNVAVGLALIISALQLISSPTDGASMMMKSMFFVSGLLMLYAFLNYFKIIPHIEN
ncbi:DUF4306 domain-containing protein [Sutcliffiella halmapala]|uniref:DUF4306 domain-containing protein n=1 Tax=Sutcliffiella halmapala TaxID=79882 RepID=UPI0014751F3B|nr:DUF4306 domain-containing protein [Sutcliffiella halmapala]